MAKNKNIKNKTKAIKEKNVKKSMNKCKLFSCILQYFLIAAVITVGIFVICVGASKENLAGIVEKTFQQYFFFWLIIILPPMIMILLALAFGWFALTQEKRTHRSFLVLGTLTAFYSLIVTCELISYITIPELKPVYPEIENMFWIIQGVIGGIIITSLIFAASQRSFSKKRTLGFLLGALGVSLVFSVYNTVIIVFPHSSSNLYIAAIICVVWSRTLVIATFISLYLVRMFRMSEIIKKVDAK